MLDCTATPPARTPAGVGRLRGFMPPDLLASRVLVIDDNEGILRLLTRLLQDAGITAIEATTDPVRGLELFGSFGPDLVMLDLHMPAMDGFEVLTRLHDQAPDGAPVPVVMLTGDKGQNHRTRALAMGASDFLVKPFDATEVALRLRGLLQTRSLQQRLAGQNQALEARVAERTRELEASQLEMLRRLADAAELRDDDTGQHTQRVGRLAGRLARALSLGEAQAALITRAAPLHDIGKIGVSDAILRKPGKLTDEEYREMKTHAAVGARILAGGRSQLIQMAERIAHCHHERWDGAGYPQQLAGEDIPLEARIVAVVDFFDALTHERPYRGAVPVRKTLEMIGEGSGSHFDPAVAAAFIAMIEEQECGTAPELVVTCQEAA